MAGFFWTLRSIAYPLPLTSGVTGTLPVANGGTGTTVFKTSTFTAANAATTTVNDAVVTANSIIFLQATNAAAGTLQGSAAHLYISARNAGVSFVVSTADGSSSAGTETFNYLIVG